ncbi:MAG TPA: hypothetical protein VED41_02550 [Solirubrobacteraceae bacterium]|nr:hypothetical protein [Solirubrobacteraceae bacterium]
MKLSVLCPTRDPGARVRALLAPFAEIAHEIVVAADASVGDRELAGYAQAADRLLRVEYPGPGRSLAYLHAQCSGDWVLSIAGDEVASPGLLRRLAQLPNEGDVQQYILPVRWLFPDERHWLDELPWSPDYQNRLVRNDASLWFPGETHTGAAPLRPARYLEEPLYHLDCVLTSERERAAKAARYETSRAGLHAPGGGPFNERYYLPERHAHLVPAPVDAEERAAIRAVLEASTSAATEPPRDIPLVTRERLLACWDGRELAAGAYRADIATLERDLRMQAGEVRALFMRIVNEGEEHWPWATPAQRPNIRLSYRWWTEDGSCLGDGERSSLPHPVGPGESCIAPMNVRAPARPGRYELEVDLVHEDVRWFGCPLRLGYEVGWSDRALVARSAR